MTRVMCSGRAGCTGGPILSRESPDSMRQNPSRSTEAEVPCFRAQCKNFGRFRKPRCGKDLGRFPGPLNQQLPKFCANSLGDPGNPACGGVTLRRVGGISSRKGSLCVGDGEKYVFNGNLLALPPLLFFFPDDMLVVVVFIFIVERGSERRHRALLLFSPFWRQSELFT